MNNRNRVTSKGRRKQRPKHILKPADGVREYYSDASTAAAFGGLVPLTVIRFIMTVIELKANFDIFCIFSAAGVLALLAGTMLPFILTRRDRYYTSMAAWISLTAVAGFALLFVSDLKMLFGEPDILGAFQIITMLVFMACESLALISLFVSSLGKRIKPSSGIPAAVSFAVSGLTYVFRAATSFSSLLTALGKNDNWANTSDLVSAKRWILRSVEQSSAQAHSMLTVSLLYSLAVILAMLFSISAVFGFKSRFEDFNRRLFASADTEKYTRYNEEDDDYEDDYDSRRADPYGLDYYDGIETLERDRYEIQKHEQLKEYRRESELVKRRAAHRAAETDDYRFDESIYDEIERSGDASYDNNYDELRERTADSAQTIRSNPPEPPERTPSGAIRVKVNTVKKENEQPVIPDPDDESIWNHYLE